MPKARQRRLGGVALLAAMAAMALPATVPAASPPTLGPTWAGDVFATSARLHTEITPGGAATSYHFDYITAAAFEANIDGGKDGFTGAAKAPTGLDPTVGSGATAIAVSQPLSALLPETSYRYRPVAKNSFGTVFSPALTITTQGFASGGSLLDGRGWEMVSPVEKNGGQVDAPETVAAGGVYQAAAQGGAVTYSSASSFGSGGQGAPQGSQYIATRDSSGWATENITTPMLSASYGSGPVGVPYQIFSGDLTRTLLLNGRHCRGEAPPGGCPIANPPLTGSGAPAGYQNYYLRDSSPLGFEALIGAGDLATTFLASAQFDLAFAGASADLRHVVLSTCAALTPNAIEIPDGEGCDEESANLYGWSEGELELLNLLPAQSQGAPGAALAAPSGAISADGSRVYFTEDANLYLREGNTTKQPDGDVLGSGEFRAASADGSVAFFTKAQHLYRYEALADAATDLTPAGGVVGVLGASADGSHLYYATASGIFLRHGATTSAVAPATDAGNYPPAAGVARVSADGTRLVFLSTAPLTGFDNTDQKTGKADSQLFLYDATADALTCVSCNSSGARPIGPSSIPGAYSNGSAPGSTNAYKPRALSADGNRLFFDSIDALVLGDTNAEQDVFEWEAQGTGSCTRVGGCLALISSGKDARPASFIDASADGADAYFLTDRSLAPADPGSVDLYDARVGGGFPAPFSPIPCEGDACQSLPSEPEDPAVTTLVSGPGNPAVRYPKRGKKHKKQQQKRRHQAKHRKGGGR